MQYVAIFLGKLSLYKEHTTTCIKAELKAYPIRIVGSAFGIYHSPSKKQHGHPPKIFACTPLIKQKS